jgi:hypothetical protein
MKRPAGSSAIAFRQNACGATASHSAHRLSGCFLAPVMARDSWRATIGQSATVAP